MAHSVNRLHVGVFGSIYLIQVVEQELRAGNIERAKAKIEQADAKMRTNGLWFCGPEIHRLRGEILLAQSTSNAAEAEHAYREAIKMATQQGLPSA